MRELDTVVLVRDLPEHSLKRGDMGAIVLMHEDGAFEVEFVTVDGEALAIVTLTEADVRPMRRGEIAHARRLASTSASRAAS